MPLTVIVRSAEAAARITFDGSRIVIGRGASSDVRLPDPSVSQRHASVHVDAGDYTLVDESSRNGTFVGGARLSPGAPRVLKSGDIVRVGRVWLEMRIEQAAPTADLPNATRDLALALVSQAMQAIGDDTLPKVRIVEGSDVDAGIVLEDEGRAYVVGRGDTCDLLLDDVDASREHVQIVRRGSVVLVRDLDSKNGAWLGDARVERGRDVPWRPTVVLRIGRTVLVLDEPVARALAELEQAPDEALDPAELPPPPRSLSQEQIASSSATHAAAGGFGPLASSSSVNVGGGEIVPSARPLASTTTAPGHERRKRQRWSRTDAAVIAIAVVVLAASLAGLLWLLRS